MNFLLTNDDGLAARGLSVLQSVVTGLGTPYLVAPLEEHSNGGHRVSYQPIEVQQQCKQEYGIDGTPADCVRLGLRYLVPETNYVLSGINHGANLGADVFMSGTVAAAREAALCGLPAIALSQYRDSTIGEIDWERTARWTLNVLSELLPRPLNEGEFWNVNFPHISPEAPEPKIVECGLEGKPHELHYEQSGTTFQFRGCFQSRGRTDGSDVDACFTGDIVVTRLSLR